MACFNRQIRLGVTDTRPVRPSNRALVKPPWSSMCATPLTGKPPSSAVSTIRPRAFSTPGAIAGGGRLSRNSVHSASPAMGAMPWSVRWQKCSARLQPMGNTWSRGATRTRGSAMYITCAAGRSHARRAGSTNYSSRPAGKRKW